MLKNLSLSIRGKFFFIIGLTLFCFILMLSSLSYTAYRLGVYQDAENEFNELFEQNLAIRKSKEWFLESLNEQEHSFFQTGINKAHQNCISVFEQNIILLQKLINNPVVKAANLESNLIFLKENITEHKEIFKKFSDKLKIKGNDNFGLTGGLNAVAHRLIDNKEDNKMAFNYALQLREVERSYIILQDEAFLQRFEEIYTKFRKKVEDSTSNVQKYILDDFELYRKNFLELAEINRDIGQNHSQGIRKEMIDLMQNFEIKIKSIQNIIEKRKENVIAEQFTSVFVIFGIVLIVLIFIILKFAASIIRPLVRLRRYIDRLSKGELPENQIILQNEDELYKINSSLNNLIGGLKKTTQFAIAIGENKFETQFKPLSSKDDLGNSLLDMRDSLLKAAEEEKLRKQDDEKRNWTTLGIARFGDILRQNYQNITELSYSIINNLVKYLSANQGGLFWYNDDNEDEAYLELLASHAYNRRKFIKKRVDIGEGLIGMCAMEKETTFMTNLPNDYIKITSGLGDSNPRSLLIVPLLIEGQVLGIIEIASFEKLQKYEIDFVEKIAENIASTLLATKINQRTNHLLEQSKQQSEAMAAQEEEMRQNLEELQTTQEESARREAEMRDILDGIETAFITASLNEQGLFTDLNNDFLRAVGMKRNELIGSEYSAFLIKKGKTYDDYHRIWDKILKGETFNETFNLKNEEKEIWLSETYIPVFDNNENLRKVIIISNEISESKQQEVEIQNLLQNTKKKEEQFAVQEQIMQKGLTKLDASKKEIKEKEKQIDTMLKAIDKTVLRCEYNKDGSIISANNNFANLFAINLEETKRCNIRNFVPDEERSFFEEIWQKITNSGEFFSSKNQRWICKDKIEELNITYTAIKNKNGEIEKILFIGNNCIN